VYTDESKRHELTNKNEENNLHMTAYTIPYSYLQQYYLFVQHYRPV